jgi:segregation and condensation protein B
MSRRRNPSAEFDRELAELPDSLRWREWMGRVEAAIFASPAPVSRETLTRLVGDACRLDDLLADIGAELRARPYEIVRVAGGWQFRTRPRHAAALRMLDGVKHGGAPEFTRLEMIALSAIAYLQPITRAELSRFSGREISRDVIGRLKSYGVIDAGPRAPAPGAPVSWVTTKRFLEVFALGSLRDLPDLEAGGLTRSESDEDLDAALDDALGMSAEEAADDEPDTAEFDEPVKN